MLSKETSLFNRNMKISSGIADAKQETHRYITEVDQSGIWVCPDGEGPNNGAATSTTRGWHIADAIELFVGTARYIKAWLNGSTPTIRLGQDSSGHTDVTPSGMEVFTDASTSVAEFGSNSRIGQSSSGHVNVTSSGMDVYTSTSSSASVASFGSTVRLGKAASGNVEMASHTGGNGANMLFNYNGNAAAVIDGTVISSGGRTSGYLAECVTGYDSYVAFRSVSNGTLSSAGLVTQSEPDYDGELMVGNHMIFATIKESGVTKAQFSIDSDGVHAGTLNATTLKQNGTALGSLATKSSVSLSFQTKSGESATQTIAAGGHATFTVTPTIPSGYTIVGVTGIYTNNRSVLHVGNWSRSGNEFTVNVHSTSASQQTNVKVTVEVVCAGATAS